MPLVFMEPINSHTLISLDFGELITVFAALGTLMTGVVFAARLYERTTLRMSNQEKRMDGFERNLCDLTDELRKFIHEAHRQIVATPDPKPAARKSTRPQP